MTAGRHLSNDQPVRPEAATVSDPAPRIHRARDEALCEKPVASDNGEDEIDEEARPEPDQAQEQETPAASPSRSRRSSFARTNATVPRAQRRGLLGRITLIPEIERPYDYKNSTKWIITAIVALAGAAAPMGSGIFMRQLSPPLSVMPDSRLTVA